MATSPGAGNDDLILLALPEPPSINTMLGYAKAWRGRKYKVKQNEYRALMTQLIEDVPRPPSPWPRWELVRAHFRLWNMRDPLDLLAGTKWPIDLLIDLGFIEDDADRNVVDFCKPTAEIDRGNRGLDLVLRRHE